MQITLERQVALVTGASTGIGAAVAEALAHAGAAVAINYHQHAAPAEAGAQRIRQAGGRAIALAGDVADEAAVESLVQRTVEAFGRLDILVANAGLQRDAPIGEMTLAQWNQVIATNLGGQFLCARAAIRQFRRQGHDPSISKAAGKILHMSSVHQVIPWAGHSNYAASKGGVNLLMRTLAQETAAERIRVNGIAPGAIATAINREAMDTAVEREKLLRLIPCGRIGEPADVARAAVWLVSDAADYVVGTTLFVDGGMGLYPAFRDAG